MQNGTPSKPGTTDSPEAQTQPQMPTIEACIKTACASPKEGYNYDLSALIKLTAKPDRILQFLQTDAQHIAHANDDFIDEYFARIRAFLQIMLNCLDPNKAPNPYHLMLIIHEQYLDDLKAYAKELRTCSTKRMEGINLDTAMRKWNNAYNASGSIPSLAVIEGDETYSSSTPTAENNPTPPAKEQITTPPPLETSAFSGPTNRSKRHSGTIAVLKAYNPTEPAETVAETKKKAATAAKPPTPKLVPVHSPDVGAKSVKGTMMNLPAITWVPEAEAPQPEPQPEQIAPAPEPKVTELPKKIDTPPQADDWDYAIFSPSEKLEADTKLFKKSKPSSIAEIFDIRSPQSQDEWNITLQNLKTAMIKSLEPLREVSAETGPMDENKEREIFQLMINALNKTGNPEYRKQLVHEVHASIKESDIDPKIKASIVGTFALALTSRPEFEELRAVSKTMKSIYDQPNGSEPKPNDVKPNALAKGFIQLTEADIYDAPKELQRPLLDLLNTSRNLGLSHYGYGIRATEPNVEKMNPGDFRLMCLHILRQLQEVEDQVKWKPLSRATWKNGKRGKARAYVSSLREILIAQMTIMEELMFSNDLFIPKETTDF